MRRTLVHLETAQRIGKMGSWEGILDDNHQIYWSPQVYEIAGWDPEETPTFEAYLEAIHPDDRQRVLAARADALIGRAPYSSEFRIVRPDGEVRFVRLEATTERRPGEPIRLIGVVQDRTDEWLAAHRLREVEESRRILLHEMLRSRESVRSDLARALHDGPVQELTAALLQLDIGVRDPDSGAADEARASVRRAIEMLRSTVFELEPAIEGNDSLREAIEHMCTRNLSEHQVEVDVDLRVDPGDDVPQMVFRIAAEAIRNVRNHAAASSVRVQLRASEDGTVLRIKDDGCGFDPKAHRPEPGHLGLPSMRENAEAGGGSLEIRSDGRGTEIIARFPPRRPDQPPT